MLCVLCVMRARQRVGGKGKGQEKAGNGKETDDVVIRHSFSEVRTTITCGRGQDSVVGNATVLYSM